MSDQPYLSFPQSVLDYEKAKAVAARETELFREFRDLSRLAGTHGTPGYPWVSDTFARCAAIARPTRVHHLKCWTQFFDAILRGEKTCELRRNDRDFMEGDILHLWDYDQKGGRISGSGRQMRVRVIGLQALFELDKAFAGWVLMSIAPCPAPAP